MAKENKSAGGIGESKVFTAPEGTFDDQPVLHMGGKPIPPELLHAVPWANTDEGIAEAEARPGPRASVEVLSDETMPGRHAQRFKESAEQGKPWLAGNEMMRLMDVYRPEGHKVRFLADEVNKKSGLRGYQVVKDEHGEPVRFGNSVLGSVPDKRAREMERDFAGSLPNAESVSESHLEQMKAGSVGGAPAAPAEFFRDAQARGVGGLQQTQGGGFRE